MSEATHTEPAPRLPVLVVEDDQAIRATLAELLVDEGYDVDCAADGNEALAMLHSERRKPAVIVLDLWMPHMDGLAFRAAQLSEADTKDIPVVVVTAGGVAPGETAALGLAYVLRKPVDVDLLLRVVRRLAARGHGSN